MDPIIQIKDLSKMYRLGTVGTGSLANDLKRWWFQVRGKEDPFLKIGETNDRSTSGKSDYVWALKDINLDIMPGEVVGIIGKNGAGKSTLLKILSKVTGPTTGSIQFNGRIGSLLEVGTGFHPELTGRENIFLNGAILGMTKREIRSKLDEIVDFSGCERYIDTPVKRYSSGMMVRLGFAVAAHLEPEILVVDEVLAVGDAEFQKKAIGKMKDVSKNSGRTVLFVSHNMASIEALCDRTILVHNGGIEKDGPTDEVVTYYNNTRFSNELNVQDCRLGGLPQTVVIESIQMEDEQQGVDNCGPWRIQIKAKMQQLVSDPIFLSGTVFSTNDYAVGSFFNSDPIRFDEDGECCIVVTIPPFGLAPGSYYWGFCLGVGLISNKRINLDVVIGLPYFEVKATALMKNAYYKWNSKSMGGINIEGVDVESF